MPVRERLGELEAIDVVEIARQYAALEYVDSKRIGVWGWVSRLDSIEENQD